jgi:hypothetical protein
MILGLSKGCRGAPFIILADSRFIFPHYLPAYYQKSGYIRHV